jgi:hypothetical protein
VGPLSRATRARAATPAGADLAIPQLGVGLGYQAQLRPFIESHPDAFDFLEVVPDILWTDRGRRARPRYIPLEEGVRFLRQVAATKRVVPHSIGLSIGSAHRFERAHVEQMARWYDWLRFPWHSDHLAFHLAAHGDDELNLNLTMPLALDRQTLELLVPRVREIRRRIPVPFLLENNVYYFRLAGEELDEATFLAELVRQSGGGLLLDLHNLHANSVNLGWDPRAYLDRLDLDRVIEIHVAGGMRFRGFYLDAHSGPVPEPVWRLLEWVLPRCRRLGGVVFELFGSWFDVMGEDRLRAQLARVRELWGRHRPPLEGA